MKTYRPDTTEYSSYLDLPKRQYFGEREDGGLSYGEEGEVLQVFGDGFSVMYV